MKNKRKKKDKKKKSGNGMQVSTDLAMIIKNNNSMKRPIGKRCLSVSLFVRLFVCSFVYSSNRLLVRSSVRSSAFKPLLRIHSLLLPSRLPRLPPLYRSHRHRRSHRRCCCCCRRSCFHPLPLFLLPLLLREWRKRR